MKIDRTRFLLLAAALSANACTIVDARGQDDTGVGGDDSATVADSTTADGTTDSTVTDGDPADSATDGSSGDALASDATADGASSDGASSDGASADALSSDALSADVNDTPACTNEGFTVPACDLGDAACGAETTQCTGWNTYFKSKIAKKATECLIALPTCEGADLLPCVQGAFDEACLDEDVSTFCAGLVTACSNPGDAGTDAATSTDAATDAGGDAGTYSSTQLLADCLKYAPGMLSAGRTRLQTVATTIDEGRCSVPLRDLLGDL